jgi:hypothetical protein
LYGKNGICQQKIKKRTGGTGQKLPEGVFFLRLKTDEGTNLKKMAVIN